MKPTRLIAATLLVAASLLQGGAWAARPPTGVMPLSSFPREPIVIETRSARRHELDAWRADTPATREQGLMFVEDMLPQQAMIFVYEPPQYVAMWMKNTLLPLDMLFADESGCVVKTEIHARPQSLDTIQATVPVALVVELKGGTAKALGVGVGDRVRRPNANWPTQSQPCTRQR
jgi:uncharacterized protein